mgnify:CR=1 FL=1
MSKNRKLRSRKAGMPPGSLVHIGEVKTEQPVFTLIDFDREACEESQPISAEALAHQPQGRTTRWANVYGLHDAASLATACNRFGLHPLVQEDILNTSQRQKVERYDNYLYIVLHRYDLKDTPLELHPEQISLVVGRDFLLSFQERPSKTFEPVRQRLRAEHNTLRSGGASVLAYSLIDATVDSYFSLIEQLSEHAEQLESEILHQPKPSTLEGIHQLKRCISGLRRDLYPLREVLSALHRDAGDFFADDIQLYLRDVYDHSVHIIESLEDLRDLATGLLDVYLSTVSHRLNLEVRTLTVAATIFMPATLIAGIFGMNFHEMPWLEKPDGFQLAIGLMACIATIMLLLFWRRKYL